MVDCIFALSSRLEKLTIKYKTIIVNGKYTILRYSFNFVKYNILDCAMCGLHTMDKGCHKSYRNWHFS